MIAQRRLLASLLAAVALVTAGGLAACGDDSGGDSPNPTEAGAETAPPLDAPVDSAPVKAEFGLDTRPANTTCKAPARPPATGPVTLERVYPNLAFPAFIMAMAQPPGDKTRWFAALRDGRIVSFPAVNPPNDPVVVADIAALSGMPMNDGGEGGLLGFAFHPKFAQNGQAFVSWTTTGPNPSGMRSIVSRITSTDGGATFTQYKTIVEPFDQPTTEHKGGCALFGPDGFLYLSFGDGSGGPPGSVYGYGQLKDSFFSKIVRLDVDSPPLPGLAYAIPDGNPYKNGGGEPALFAFGFRNPFRFSIDRATGDVWVGDVGQYEWEEIDVVKAGANAGWPCREGAHDYEPPACDGTESLVEPVFDYSHGTRFAAVTGGVVYRGSAIPGLQGTYVFGDSSSLDVWTLAPDATGTMRSTAINAAGPREVWVGFSEDVDGEVYALDLGGKIYKLVAAQPAPPSTFPDRLSKTGCVDPADPKKPAAGLVPYDVRSPLWSDGADKERFLALPDGATIAVDVTTGDFDLPIGSVLTKTFSLGGKRIETRLFVRHDDGDWAGYTYEWNDAQTDADLLPAGKAKKVGAQSWTFPSRGACLGCHSAAAGRTLGLEIGQLNGDLLYGSTNRIANQLKTLEHIGMLAAPLSAPVAQLAAYPVPSAAGPVEPRARSYLHSNCSNCHRPSGPGRGDLDLRFATPLAQTKTCGPPKLGDLGVADAGVLSPGNPARSVLSLRPHALGAVRMPPLASTVVDTAGLTVVDDWIRSLTACP